MIDSNYAGRIITFRGRRFQILSKHPKTSLITNPFKDKLYTEVKIGGIIKVKDLESGKELRLYWTEEMCSDDHFSIDHPSGIYEEDLHFGLDN